MRPLPSRRRLLAFCVALASTASTPIEAAEPRPRSEYRLWTGVHHQGELLSANLLTGGRLVFRGADALMETAAPASETPEPIAITLRAGELVLVDLPILTYTISAPHEIAGHAARYWEFDAVPEIHLGPPLPYDPTTHPHVTLRQRRTLYTGELSVAALAGLSVEEAAQRMLVWSTFRTGTLRRGEAIMYTSVAVTKAGQTLTGGDLRSAAALVGPLSTPSAYRATTRGALVLDLIDPMLLYSIYASTYRWLVRGDTTRPAPGLEIGHARLLATSRTMPVPWGVEHQLHILAAWPWATFDLGVRTGVGARESLGLELATFDWRFLGVMRAGGELAAWTQPFLESLVTIDAVTGGGYFGGGPLGGLRDRPDATPTTVGGAARIHFEILQPSWFLGTRLGWKSVGLWGERELAEGGEVALTGGFMLD